MGTLYNPSVNTDGLLVLLDAANTKSYSGGGSTWYDVSGSGFHATLYNTTFGNTAGTPSIICNGTNGWVGNTTMTAGLNDFTIECAFYHNGLDQGGSYGVISIGANGNYGPMFYNHNGGSGGHYFPGSPGGDYPGGVAGWNNLQWNYQTWVYRNTVTSGAVGSLRTYINGIYNTGTSNFDFHNSGSGRGSNGYALGTYSGGAAPYKGSFSTFRVYNRALSDAEVLQNYDSIKGRFGR